MSFESIRRAFKKAEKHDDVYHVQLRPEDFFDLVDMVDHLEQRRKASLHRVKAKTLLQILPEMEAA